MGNDALKPILRLVKKLEGKVIIPTLDFIKLEVIF
jgi:hypothetical protein